MQPMLKQLNLDLEFAYKNMKQYLYIVFIFSSFFVYSQEDKNATYIEFDYFYGNIIEHAPELKPIIQANI